LGRPECRSKDICLKRKPDGSFEMDPSVSGYEPVEDSCIYNSEPPNSIKVKDFPEYVRND
jgi:hypothetical protein